MDKKTAEQHLQEFKRTLDMLDSERIYGISIETRVVSTVTLSSETFAEFTFSDADPDYLYEAVPDEGVFVYAPGTGTVEIPFDDPDKVWRAINQDSTERRYDNRERLEQHVDADECRDMDPDELNALRERVGLSEEAWDELLQTL